MLVALVLGATFAGALVLPPALGREPTERVVWASIVGLALLAHLCFGLGLVGAMHPLPLALAATALAGAGAWRACAPLASPGGATLAWRAGETLAVRAGATLPRPAGATLELPAGAPLALPAGAPLTWRTGPRNALVAALPWLVTASLVAALACYPPSAFDETLYHLPYARALAATGSLPFLPALRFPIFPQLDEALRAGVLLFAGDVATHAVAVASTLLTAGLLRIAGGRRAGALAAATYLGNPLVVYLAGTGYVEPFLALFATAALVAATRAGDEARWCVVSGFCAGTAAATKYLGLPFAFAAAVGVALVTPAGRRRPALLAYAGAALAAALPTYARLAVQTGNPVFPFLAGLFGPAPWSPFESMTDPLTSLAGLPGALLDLTLHRAATARLPPITPVYLAAVPLLAWAAWRDRRVRRPLAIAIGYAALVPPRAHYLVPALPFASLAVGAALTRLADVPALAGRLHARRVVVAACVALLLPGWLYAGHLALRRGPVPTDAAARERWLAVTLPAYPAVAFLDRTAGPTAIAYGFGVENLKYFVRGTLLGEWNGPYAYAAVRAAGTDPASLNRTLRAFGATHLVVSRDQPVLGLADDAETARWFARRFADAHAEVYELRSPR